MDAKVFLKTCGLVEEDGAVRRLKKGAVVDDTYRGVRCVCYVARGSLSVHALASDAKEVLISVVPQGGIFGVCNLFLDAELRTMLTCRTDCELWLVSKDLLRKRLLARPEAMEAYGVLCNGKLQYLLRRIEELSGERAEVKLASFLLGHPTFRGTMTMLAQASGISRASLYRVLADLASSGIIRRDGSAIVVCDRGRLREKAGR